MKAATATIYLDPRPKKNGKCNVKLKVTFNRKRKYYPVNMDLTNSDFEKIINGKRLTTDQRNIKKTFSEIELKADKVIQKMKFFTFNAFEEAFFENRNITNSVQFAFDKEIKQLKENDKIGTAVTYQCAINSLEKFFPGLTFADITPVLLNKYERWMLKDEKSPTTISMYVRCLRKIFNLQNIDASLYPFGKGKYEIPTGRNVKKALTVEEISRIYNYEAEPNTNEEMAKDYWLFLYLCNGMNVKDFCLLKWQNIDNDVLVFERAKTKGKKKEADKITVALKPETKAIIKKWGQPSVLENAFIFPHLNHDMNAERQRQVYQQLTKIINKYMKRIAKNVGIKKPVTTYYARHSFATVLKRSGAKIEMISELLGHSSVLVTQNYLDGFEKEQIQKATDQLTVGFKKTS